MGRGIFVAGTGTEVGKTIVTAGLLRRLRREGLDAVSMKPVQTGASRSDDGSLCAPDLMFHRAVAGLGPASKAENVWMAPYLYGPACSPHLAGRLAGEYPDMDYMLLCAAALLDTREALLVEGAGGIMVPLDEKRTMLDLMRALNFPVILVAHIGLGTINHTLLSLEALRGAGLDVLGVVFNEPVPVEDAEIKKDNPGIVASLGDVSVLGNLRYEAGLSPDSERFWDRFDEDMPGFPELRAACERHCIEQE